MLASRVGVRCCVHRPPMVLIGIFADPDDDCFMLLVGGGELELGCLLGFLVVCSSSS